MKFLHGEIWVQMWFVLDSYTVSKHVFPFVSIFIIKLFIDCAPQVCASVDDILDWCCDIACPGLITLRCLIFAFSLSWNFLYRYLPFKSPTFKSWVELINVPRPFQHSSICLNPFLKVTMCFCAVKFQSLNNCFNFYLIGFFACCC